MPLNPEFRAGTQLFVNPDDSPDLLRRRVATLREAEFSLLRLFLTWDMLESADGQWRWSPFDEIFDAAAQHGMGVVATLMGGSPPRWMNLTCGPNETADLDDPAFFEQRALAYVRKVVEHWRAHPALDSWILWNEPGYTPDPASPHARRAYCRYVEKTYGGDLDAYRADHFPPVQSFADVDPAKLGLNQGGFLSHHCKVERLHFTVSGLREKLDAIAAQVRALDPDHPLHVNPHRVSQCLAHAGQSLWQEAETVDFMGCSAHPAWHSVRFPRERFADSVALFADLTRSATRAADDYFWVTELQGGTTLLSGFMPLNTTPAEARLWLWEGIASGAKAVVYWCANTRHDGFEAGEWDILDTNGAPTPQLATVSATLRALLPRRELLRDARPPRPDVGILVSDASQILDLVEGEGDSPANPRNIQRGSDAVSGAYLLAADHSLEVRFYNEQRLAETPAAGLPPLLLAPSLTVSDPATIRLLADLVRGGKTLIADGFFAWKNPFGKLAADCQPLADALFGAQCTGYEALADGDTFSNIPGSFSRARLRPATAQVRAAWTDGTPAVTEHQLGSGVAIRVGTQFFQPCMTVSDPARSQWFRQQLPAPSLLANPSPTLRLRRLRHPAGELGILLNRAPVPQTATVSGREYQVPAQDALIISSPQPTILQTP